jgi:hypothetical protein
VAKNVKLFLERLRKTWQFLPQHFVSSATKKIGKDKILTLIDEKNEAKKVNRKLYKVDYWYANKEFLTDRRNLYFHLVNCSQANAIFLVAFNKKSKSIVSYSSSTEW